MRLRKNRIPKNNPLNPAKTNKVIPSIKKSEKNINMDPLTQRNQNESVYLNKILKKNIGTKKATSDFPNFKENIPNFHSSIQNILSNEENREKAMKYVINMRSRRGDISISPFDSRYNNKSRNIRNVNGNNSNTNYINPFKTINQGFYEEERRKKNITFEELNSKNINNNMNKNLYYEGDLKKNLSSKNNNNNAIMKPYTGFNIYTDRLQRITTSNENRIKVNKMNRYSNELDNNSKDEKLFFQNKIKKYRNNSNNQNDFSWNNNNNNLNIYRNTSNNSNINRRLFFTQNLNDDNYDNFNINKNNKNINNYNYDNKEENNENINLNINNNYNDDFIEDINVDNIQLKESSLSENNEFREIIAGNIKGRLQSPLEDNFNDNDDDFRNNNKYIKPSNYIKYSNMNVYGKYRNKNINKKIYVNKKKEIDDYNSFNKKNINDSFNNLKIEKSNIEIKPKNNKIIKKPIINNYNFDIIKKNKFFLNKTVTAKDIDINGEINNLNKITNNDKNKLEGIKKLKNEINILKGNSKDKKDNKIKDKDLEEKNYLNKEIDNLKNENKKLIEEINNYKKYEEELNKIKNDYDKLKEENDKNKIEYENKIKEQQNKYNDEINKLKEENEKLINDINNNNLQKDAEINKIKQDNNSIENELDKNNNEKENISIKFDEEKSEKSKKREKKK